MPADRPYPNETTDQFMARLAKKKKRRSANPFKTTIYNIKKKK